MQWCIRLIMNRLGADCSTSASHSGNNSKQFPSHCLSLSPNLAIQLFNDPFQLPTMDPMVNGCETMPLMGRHGSEPRMRMAHVAAERTEAIDS